MAQCVKPVAAISASQMGACSDISCFTLVPCKWYEKAAGKGQSAWVPATLWQTCKKLLVPGFELAQSWLLQPIWE